MLHENMLTEGNATINMCAFNSLDQNKTAANISSKIRKEHSQECTKKLEYKTCLGLKSMKQVKIARANE